MTQGLIDVHCHLLPAVDDGAESLADSLELLRLATAEGISKVVLTPHIHLGRYPNVRSTLRPHFDKLVAEIARREIPIELRLGGEVRASDDVFTLIERDEIPLLGGARPVMLLEFPHGQLTPGWQQLLRWLVRYGITPLIAHPERNKEVMRNPEKVKDMRDAGALVQLTAAAVAGDFGGPAAATAKTILKKGWATVLASDAHNVRHRPPALQSGVRAAALIVGDSQAWDMVTVIPERLAFSESPALPESLAHGRNRR